MSEFKGFTKKQIECLSNANHRYNIMYGGSRAGKSYLSLFILLMKIRELKDKDGINLILGYTRETLMRNVVLPLQELYGNELVSNIHYDNTIDLFGEKAYALGCNNANAVDRIRGSSVKLCIADELATYPEEVFSMLQSRLDKPYSRFYASLNPTGKNNWVYKLLFEKPDIDLYKCKFTIYDNPTLDKTFVENLEREYKGTVWYDRLILGNFVEAEGLIYPMFNRQEKLLNLSELDIKFKRYVVGVDYGIQNPTAFVLLGITYDNKVYLIKEYYYSGRETNKPKTDSEFTESLSNFVNGYNIEAVIVDPSASSFIVSLKRLGFPVRKANNSVLDGIRTVANYYNLGKLYIDKGCSNYINEIENYVWKKNTEKEEPVKDNDHLQDAMRYGIMYLSRAESSQSFNF